MSASIRRPSQDLVPATPTFSYAQAARGRASATTNQQKRAPSENSGALSKRDIDTEGTSNLEQDMSQIKRATSEGRMPETSPEEIEVPVTSQNKSTEIAPSINGALSASDQMEENSKAAITPPSSDYGTNSLSTLQKEDDGFSGTNASSESTWEKISQSSQNGTQKPDKLATTEPATPEPTSAWEEEIPADNPSLKEAPLPPVNFWQKRQEAQAAKLKDHQPAPGAVTQGRLQNGHDPTPVTGKSTNGKLENAKQETKRKGRIGNEEKPQLESPRGGTRDRKPKSLDGNPLLPCLNRLKTLTPASDKEPTNLMAPPPPPGDAVSWPTPETAVVEDRKKPTSQPKVDEPEKEKETPQKSKSTGKKAWTQMEFVPSAVFETHLPQSRRGGRGPSGGRDSQPRGGRNNTFGSRNGDKLGNVSVPSTPHTAADETKANGGPVPPLTNNSQSKRSSSAGPATTKEARKSLTGNAEKLNQGVGTDVPQNQPRKSSLTDFRRPSVPVPATPQVNINQGRNPHAEVMAPAVHQTGLVQDTERVSQGVANDNYSQRKASGAGRRQEGSSRTNESPKEVNLNGLPREREERSGRGSRGGRGRGGTNHTAFNGLTHTGNSYTNSPGVPYSGPYSAPMRTFSNHERTPSQSQGMPFPTSPHRNNRSVSGRTYYAPGYPAPAGRFTQPPNSGPPHLPNIQTDMGGAPLFSPEPQGVMSAIPYNPYEQQPLTVWDMVQAQMEYYFSVDNLCKDVFLRKHMDSQGFVFLSVLANFNRIVSLTTDIEIIRYVCLSSQKIEFKPGQVWQDGFDRLRAREGWKNFTLPKDQRDPSAQNDGPSPVSVHVSGESSHVHDDRQMTSPSLANTNGALDFPYQSLNAIAPQTTQAPPAPLTNGNHPPLSAAVSEFSPSAHSHVTRRFASPDSHSHQDAKPFPEEEIPQLSILVRQPLNSPLPPFHSASSRTFSNGSIDGRSISDELSRFSERQSRPVQPGVFEGWVAHRLTKSLHD